MLQAFAGLHQSIDAVVILAETRLMHSRHHQRGYLPTYLFLAKWQDFGPDWTTPSLMEYRRGWQGALPEGSNEQSTQRSETNSLESLLTIRD